MPRSKTITLTSRAREMYAVIESWQQSGLTQKAFCEETGLPLTTFQHWLYHYRDYHRRDTPAAKRNGGFIALQAAPQPVGEITAQACEILYPNGVRLRLSALPEAELLQRLLALPVSGS